MKTKNYWHYEGKDKPDDNFLFSYIRRKFFGNKVGLGQAVISKEIYKKFINKEEEKISLLDIGGAGGHQFDNLNIKNKTKIDIDADKLKESKDWKTIQMDAKKLKFKDNTFDLVASFHTLEHIDDPLKVMEEMYRVLKPGGKVWIEVPDLEAVGFKFYDYYTHIFPFTKQRAEFMIKSCGFENIIIKKCNLPKYWFLLKFHPKLLTRLSLLNRSSLLIVGEK